MSHSAGAMRAYAETVRDRALARRLIAAADEIASSGFSDQNTPITQRIDDAQAKISGWPGCRTATTGRTWTPAWRPCSTGCRTPRRPTSSPRAWSRSTSDWMAVCAARARGGGCAPSMGKSALALTIARHVALIEGLPVGLFSMEMPKAQVWNRPDRAHRQRAPVQHQAARAAARRRLDAHHRGGGQAAPVRAVHQRPDGPDHRPGALKGARAAPPARPARATGRGLPGADERHRPQDQPRLPAGGSDQGLEGVGQGSAALCCCWCS